MALKRKITKDEFDALNESFKAEYKKASDGWDGYYLDVDGDDDNSALKRAKDREAQLRKDAEKKASELQERLDSLEGDDARKKGDIATLEKSWQSKIDAQKTEYETKLSKLNSHVTKSLVDSVAATIASKISNAPALILPHIKARLTADFEGDEPKTRILDKEGRPSALTVQELEKEFVENKDFSAIIIASKASGGAGKSSQQKSFGGAGAGGNQDQMPDLAKLKPSEMVAYLKAVKAEE